MPQLTIQPRKMPRQKRSVFTVDAILDAATRVLATESLKGFNTNRVAEVAGVSVGSLYQYFPSKDALIAELITREQECLAAAVELCIDDYANKPLKPAIEALVDIAIEHQWGNPVYAAALDHEEERLPIMETLQLIQTRIVGAVAQLLLIHMPTAPLKNRNQLARDFFVISKALIEAEPIDASKLALRKRVVGILIAAVQSQSKANGNGTI